MKRVVSILSIVAGTALAAPAAGPGGGLNLAVHATPATSYVSGHESLDAVNDGVEPAGVNDHRHGAYGNWPRTGTQWVDLAWSRPVRTGRIEVYWWDDSRGVRLPAACRLLHWDGTALVPVADAAGLGVAGGQWNVTTFREVATSRLRLEFDGREKSSTGVLEWRVIDAGGSPAFPPRVEAGTDRVAVPPAATHLSGSVRGPCDATAWSRGSGPGAVTFGDVNALTTTAVFASPGDYVLRLTARHGDAGASDELAVRVAAFEAPVRLAAVPVTAWSVDSPLWTARLRQVIVNWIPHCIAKLSEPGLKEGGIGNFVEAGNKIAGRPHQPHAGAPWANAYTMNTVESMCLALMLDPRGDADLAAAQASIRAKLEEWIPVLLAAQEPDGYLQTRFTLGTPGEKGSPPARWTRVGDHEGYVAGYFIEAAIAHLRLTGGRDRRMYEAAKRLAGCWDAAIGPAPKKTWFDGHQALELALVRLAELVDESEGAGRGDRFVALSKFLLDSRGGGESYDQSHVPVVRQYEALGHSVRAAYSYTAMADIARVTGDADYQAAVKSLWDSIVNRKYYVTGGLGSGETSEGFGRDFSLPNHAYCESCANCGLLFFQNRMHRAWPRSVYADLAEETLYNGVLGSLDLEGRTFTYTNPLDQDFARYGWHGCPCCVGNIPRTLLGLPSWMYAKSPDGLWVNLFAGGTVRVGDVAGVPVEMVQRTDYPWKGAVEIVVNPAKPVRFALHVRSPGRNASALYRASPDGDGFVSFALNGAVHEPAMKDGYAVLHREWKAGETVRIELPLPVQRVRADGRIAATRGRVALRRGPLVYNIEAVDQDIDGALAPDAPLEASWNPGLLGGVVAIRGRFAGGAELTAIPNYARNNRGGRSIVWIREP